MAELAQVAADPAIKFEDVTVGSVATDASPMRPDLVAAMTKAIDTVYPGTPVFPSMSSGASDSMWYRYHGVGSYGASPVFMKDSDDFAHGLNERVPIANSRPGVDYYLMVVRDLSK
jgi:carboxypeptidase PM20D1